jgi:intracellular multiplication protein IcmK
LKSKQWVYLLCGAILGVVGSFSMFVGNKVSAQMLPGAGASGVTTSSISPAPAPTFQDPLFPEPSIALPAVPAVPAAISPTPSPVPATLPAKLSVEDPLAAIKNEAQKKTESNLMTSEGIALPGPPAPSELSNDPVALTQAAEEASRRAQRDAEIEQRKMEFNRESFERATSGLFPLSPEQIRDFMRRLETTQESSIAPYDGPPKGEVKVTTVSLDPGVDPPIINVSAGYVTTVAMVDATGEPWPILDVGIGGNFEVSPTSAGSHVVRITPMTRFGMGNLSVLLKDLPTPVIFRLNAGGPVVHLRYDARIAKNGPNARQSLIGRTKLTAGDDTIMTLLDNAPPKNAKRIKVSGLDNRTMAWQIDRKIYVRTPLTLLSPAWNASVSSADGMTVYEVGDAPVLLMSENGVMLRAKLMRDQNYEQ